MRWIPGINFVQKMQEMKYISNNYVATLITCKNTPKMIYRLLTTLLDHSKLKHKHTKETPIHGTGQ